MTIFHSSKNGPPDSSRHSRDEPLTPAIVLIPGLVLGGLGAWVFAAGVRTAFFGVWSRRWPVARGRVAESRVDETSRGASLVVCYEYEVASAVHGGNTVGFASPGSRWFRSARRDEVRSSAAQRYAVDREVNVFYWPVRPSVSVLEPGFHWASVALIALGGTWLGVGAAVCSLAFLRYR